MDAFVVTNLVFLAVMVGIVTVAFLFRDICNMKVSRRPTVEEGDGYEAVGCLLTVLPCAGMHRGKWPGLCERFSRM
jgi:hypothetical protein